MSFAAGTGEGAGRFNLLRPRVPPPTGRREARLRKAKGGGGEKPTAEAAVPQRYPTKPRPRERP
jgi:hypothetical protein